MASPTNGSSKSGTTKDATKATDDTAEKKLLDKTLRRIDAALKPHVKHVKEYDRRERAYKGDIDWDKDTWKHQCHPHYIFQNIETLEAQLLWDSTITKVYPTKSGDEDGARALEMVLRWQMDRDDLDKKWGECVKSALVNGVGIGYIHWAQEFSIRNYDDGSEERLVSFDQPTLEVIDPRDFFMDPSASSIREAKYACIRYYQDKDWLKSMGEPLLDDEGNVLRPPRWKNVKEAIATRDGAEDGKAGKSVVKNQTDLDLSCEYEVIECFYRNEWITIVNRKVIVRDGAPPWDHNEIPIVDVYTIEDPFHFDKLSPVDAGIELQNARWEFLNQGLDAASLLNNPVVKFQSSVQDPSVYVVEPGRQWPVDHMDDVNIESWDNRVIGGFRQVLELLERDMSNVMAANPFGPSAPDEQVSPITAAEVTAKSTVAQDRVTRARSLLGYSRKRLGKLWIALDQQFLTEPLEVRTVGPAGAAFHIVDPQTIQGQYDYFIESQQESFDKNQGRQEGLNLITTISGLVGGFQNLGALGFNAEALVEKFLTPYGIDDVSKFYTTPAPPALPDPNAPSTLPPGAPPPQ